MDGGRGVAATDESVSARARAPLSRPARSSAELGDLEAPHRAVPDDGAGATHALPEQGHRLRADVEGDPSRLDRVGGKDAQLLARLDLLSAHEVDRQDEAGAEHLPDLVGGFHGLFPDHAAPGLKTPGAPKTVSPRPPDPPPTDPLDQSVADGGLVGAPG